MKIRVDQYGSCYELVDNEWQFFCKSHELHRDEVGRLYVVESDAKTGESYPVFVDLSECSVTIVE